MSADLLRRAASLMRDDYPTDADGWHRAVADWLEETIRLTDPEANCPDFDCEICSVIKRAEAVARAYLGESA